MPSASLGRALQAYFVLAFVAALANMSPLVATVDAPDAGTASWVAVTYVTHAALYAAAPLAPALLAWGLRLRRAAVALAVLAGAAAQFTLFVDVFIFTRFGYHLNGFVWNLITTPGGIDSMGGDASTHDSAAALAAGMLLASAGAMWLALRRARRAVEEGPGRAASARRVAIAVAVAVLVGDVGARVAYGLASIRGFTPILSAAGSFPAYLPLTFRSFAVRNLGVSPAARPDADVRAEAGRYRAGRLDYPRRALEARPDAPRWNVVWLVSESLRADMLDPEIMPRTWAFGARSARFTRHYSSGNGTRMGVFGMFYGLYGPYWFRFLEATRGPALIDDLRARGWRMQMQTSALFSYPEFDRTVFAAIPHERLISKEFDGPGYLIDRANVKKLLAFIDEGRGADGAPAQPFMCFQFFEGPHARYHFPAEGVLRPDYLQELNYATLDLARDMPRVKNRYVNAVHELDRQIAAVLDGLEERHLLDSTIVIITGDHGEEFMEKGHWGHNSTFVEEQIRAPLLIHIPGRAPEVIDRMTSHLDIAPTVAAALGVTNPPADWCQGADLFGPSRREFCVLAGWDELAYLDDEWKAVFPLGASGIGAGARVTRADDAPVADTRPFFAARRQRLVDVLRGLREFAK